MEATTILFIHTPWRSQSHKWTLGEDGLVDYNGQRVTPRYVYENFTTDFPMFTMLRAEVCKRVDNPDPNAERPYMWISLERFDRPLEN